MGSGLKKMNGAQVMQKPSLIVLMMLAALAAQNVSGSTRADATAQRTNLWVDSQRGSPGADGTREKPCRSLSEAFTLLPETLSQSVIIQVASGNYSTTGGQYMASHRLELMRRMRPGVAVRIVGVPGTDGALPHFAWEGGSAMILACEGEWWIENVQIGTGSTRQRRGLLVTGPAQVTLKDVTFRTRSQSDAAIYADRGGLALLRGAIRINEHMHDHAPEESFAGIIAIDHGTVRFEERQGASLDIGNGSLSASYYGCIGLGCETARITSWGEQSNTLAINNGGRIDLHNTTTTLSAKQKRNTPIGLEHDGHILAEGARIVIVGDNDAAIALQKASTLTCNDIELRGNFGTTLWASSGSMFVGRFISDITDVSADTSARINIEKLDGRIRGSVTARRCGTVALPDRNVVGQ
jgi:hypothetical protein